MTLIAGQTNTVELRIADRDGHPVTGKVNGDFTVLGVTAGAHLADTSFVTVAEIDAVNHPGLYAVTVDLTAKPTQADYGLELSLVGDTNGPWLFRAMAHTGSLSDAGTARKALTNRLDLDPATDTMKLYNDDNTLLLTHLVKDINGNTVNVGTGIPARRGKGT